MKSDATPTAFVSDLSRVATFNLDYVDSETYKPLKTQMFKLEDSLMLNETANKENAKYNVKITGTTNMTTSLKAPAFVSKGHYYQISDEVRSSVPKIVDTQGNVIEPNDAYDETRLGVEQITGVTVYAHESLLNNFQVFNDWVYQLNDNTEYGMFVPLGLVNRDAQFTPEQANEVFGLLYVGITAKWVIFGILLALGIASLALFCMYCYRRKSIKKILATDYLTKDRSVIDYTNTTTETGQTGTGGGYVLGSATEY